METTLIVVLGSVIVGFLTLGGVVLNNISQRLRVVEEDLIKERARNRMLWNWGRTILDMYYKWRLEGAPDPPDPPKEE